MNHDSNKRKREGEQEEEKGTKCLTPDNLTTCTITPYPNELGDLKSVLGRIQYGAGNLNYNCSWMIENATLRNAALTHSGGAIQKAYFIDSLNNILHIARVGFSERSSKYTVRIKGGYLISLGTEIELGGSYYDVRGRPKDKPVYLLLCNVTAQQPLIKCTSNIQDMDSKSLFNGDGVTWRDPSRRGVQCGVVHWSQVEPKFIVMLNKKRKDDLWREISLNRLSYCGITTERPKQGSGLVDRNDDFVCIWDRTPMFQIHVLVMPTKHCPSPEGLPSSSLLLNLERHVQHLIGLFQEATKINYFKYGFHADPSQEHLHCHIFTPDYLSPLAQRRPPSALKKFSSPFFISFKELSRLISSFAPPLSRHHPEIFSYDHPEILTSEPSSKITSSPSTS